MFRGGENKMKWLKRRLRNWLNEEDEIRLQRATVVERDRSAPAQNGMNFCLYQAVGGHILESRTYNQKTDRTDGTLYMIHDDEDFARQVAQAIMLEQMKL
jgi:hypothetical protein